MGQGHESDSPVGAATRFAANTTYDRFVVAPGLDGWIYAYEETHGARVGAVASAVELGVHLSGDWLQRSAYTSARDYRGGSVHVISPGESYDLAFKAGSRRGLLVGFHAHPELLDVDVSDAEVVLDPGASASSALLDVAWAVHRARAQGREIPEGAVSIIREYVLANSYLSNADGLWRAKKAIDRHFASELYLDHLAETAAMHRRTFLRRFQQRFGSSPVEYRIKQRLNHAARLAWAKPKLTVAEIAEQSGFENIAYFHRAFRRSYGTTPTIYRQQTRAAL